MKVKVWVRAGEISEAEYEIIEVDDEHLNGASAESVNGIIEEQAFEAVQKLMEWGWEIVEQPCRSNCQSDRAPLQLGKPPAAAG